MFIPLGCRPSLAGYAAEDVPPFALDVQYPVWRYHDFEHMDHNFRFLDLIKSDAIRVTEGVKANRFHAVSPFCSGSGNIPI
jgi:hypothetical protein